jgi:spore germination protein KA
MDKDVVSNKNGEHLATDLSDNIAKIKDIFSYPQNKDIQIRELHIKAINREGVLVFLQGMTDSDTLEKNIINPLIDVTLENLSCEDAATTLMKRVLKGRKVMKICVFGEIIHQVVCGYAVLLIEGHDEAIALSSIGFGQRAVEKPTVENIIKGPKEAFIESSETNRSLIRKHLRDVNLITESMLIGERGADEIFILYIKDIANPDLLQEVKRRISKINADCSYIAYTTFVYGGNVWKVGNKFGGLVIVILSFIVILLPIWVLFFVL